MNKPAEFVDYYKLLGIPTDADNLQIREAFLRLAKQHHPDHGGTTEQMQLYTTAYRTLKTGSARKAYDLLHDFHTPGTTSKYLHQTNEPRSIAGDDISDEELDDFIDTVFAEYHNAPKPKQTFFTRLKNML